MAVVEKLKCRKVAVGDGGEKRRISQRFGSSNSVLFGNSRSTRKPVFFGVRVPGVPLALPPDSLFEPWLAAPPFQNPLSLAFSRG